MSGLNFLKRAEYRSVKIVVVKLNSIRDERKPTRCNNIDDLLSIVDVDY